MLRRRGASSSVYINSAVVPCSCRFTRTAHEAVLKRNKVDQSEQTCTQCVDGRDGQVYLYPH